MGYDTKTSWSCDYTSDFAPASGRASPPTVDLGAATANPKRVLLETLALHEQASREERASANRSARIAAKQQAAKDAQPAARTAETKPVASAISNEKASEKPEGEKKKGKDKEKKAKKEKGGFFGGGKKKK